MQNNEEFELNKELTSRIPNSTEINNQIYYDLGARWYDAEDDPIALLRAENRFRNPWILEILRSEGLDSNAKVKIADFGCGAGFLTNFLAESGYSVTGIDCAEPALVQARRHDKTQRAQYLCANVLHTGLESQSFDAVCAMDLLEHIEDYPAVLTECSRVLKPGGLFFFYTFNRNFLSWLVVIKGVEWVVKNTPKNLHLYRMLIKPSELQEACEKRDLYVCDLKGVGPKVLSVSFFQLLTTGIVPSDFQFELKSNLALGYVGWARKR